MKHKNLRIIILLAAISIIGIVIIQTYWFKKAFDLKEKQFNHNVTIALQNVGEALLSYQHLPVPLESMVYQISGNYYVVSLNGEIKTCLLEFLLKKELEKRNILADFEYGVYNCQTQRMVYGNYVSFEKQKNTSKHRELPVWHDDKFYFGVYFPNKNSDMINQMGTWLFFSSILLIVCVFFSYSIFVILKQKRLTEVQKDFINNMTHEFKTPLSTIQVTTELLKKPAINQQQDQLQNYISIIQYETSRLKNHVEWVLQSAALDKEKIKLTIENVDIHECIKKAIISLDLLIQDKQGKLITDFNAAKSGVQADQSHLTNVIYNLLDNSIKYSNTDPLITVTTANDKNRLVLKIRDNGNGIPREHIHKVFDKFYRVPTGNIHNVKGFGLGLFYVKTIIKLMKGKISAESKINQGSEFTIYLPLSKY
jgi:two-component system phosphate regulon sensor histidine kinase PhoR